MGLSWEYGRFTKHQPVLGILLVAVIAGVRMFLGRHGDWPSL